MKHKTSLTWYTHTQYLYLLCLVYILLWFIMRTGCNEKTLQTKPIHAWMIVLYEDGRPDYNHSLRVGTNDYFTERAFVLCHPNKPAVFGLTVFGLKPVQRTQLIGNSIMSIQEQRMKVINQLYTYIIP